MCFCSADRLASRPPMASWCRWRASRSSASALARASRVTSSALERASERSLSASRRASATWSSAVRWAIISTRRACCSPSPVPPPGAPTGPWARTCSSSACIDRAACSAAALSRWTRSSWALISLSSAARRGSALGPAGAPPRPPRSTWARSSLFSSIRRASSRSTSSRKASTSSSSYPRLPIGGFLKATLCTSAGVSGIASPRVSRGRGWGCCLAVIHDQVLEHELHEHEQDNQQHDGSQVQTHVTNAQRWDHTPQRLEGWISDAPHRFECRRRPSTGLPPTSVLEHRTQNEPGQQDQEENVDHQVENLEHDRQHG